MDTITSRLTHADLLQLKRWNTPTIYNGWEQITRHDAARDGVQPRGDARLHAADGADGRLRGHRASSSRAIRSIREANPSGLERIPPLRRAACPGPKIVVVQDLDKPRVIGAFWGEVNSNIHRALGCVGTITDGAIRDLDEMTNAGFKALARRLCVGHAFVASGALGLRGRGLRPDGPAGQLIHADKHGFLVVPPEETGRACSTPRASWKRTSARRSFPAARGERAGAGTTRRKCSRPIDDARTPLWWRMRRARSSAKKGEWWKAVGRSPPLPPAPSFAAALVRPATAPAMLGTTPADSRRRGFRRAVRRRERRGAHRRGRREHHRRQMEGAVHEDVVRLVFVLEKPGGKWREAGKLPRPLGYGVSITADDGVLCFGGSDAAQHYAELPPRVERRRAQDHAAAAPCRSRAPMPAARSSGSTIYIAGGIETPTGDHGAAHLLGARSRCSGADLAGTRTVARPGAHARRGRGA